MKVVKNKVRYFCSECGYESSKWLGKCPGCEAWNSFTEETVKTGAHPDSKKQSQVININNVLPHDDLRMSCGIGEADKVLGGGLISGSLVLLGGDPGIGKSTLAMQIAMRLSKASGKILYASGEESLQQIKLRADRLGTCGSELALMTETDIGEILAAAGKLQPQLLIIDSIQTMYDENISSAPGSVSQVRECAGQLLRFAKEKNITVMIIGHITKEGQIAGPKLLEHMVDVVLYFEGERNYNFRVLRAQKNRFGGISDCGIFSMNAAGLSEIKNPSMLLLADREGSHPGTVVTVCMEGSRPLLLEVQALACQSYYGMPRRVVSGYDYNRLVMLLAVLEKRCGIALGQQDIFLNVIGGIRISETAADLAIVMAIVSSLRGTPVAKGAVAFGEIGLTGELRMVMNAGERVAEAAALGFDSVFLPKSCATSVKNKTAVNIIAIDDIHAVLDLI